MTTFPGSPRLVKGAIVLIDPARPTFQQVITLQYNPDTLSRTLQVQAAGGEGGDHLEALRLKGPPVETIKLEAEIDVTDQILPVRLGAASATVPEPEANRLAREVGIYPQLAALETMLYPLSSDLQLNNELARRGTLEIAPTGAPLTVFVWSKYRVVPVRITEFSVTEEAFDPALNPIRAKVSLGMRVLSVNDLGFDRTGSSLYQAYQQQKERLATKARIELGT